MSLAQIAKMRQELPPEVQIEAFAHGAQCMAVSGRCLISAYMADRSGNRGHCTQPCRWLFYDKSADNVEGGANLKALAANSSSECASLSCGAQSDLPQELILEEETRPGQEFILEQDNRGSYFFNARDLNMSAHLAEMQAAGVDSIKIEGRNKKAFYVASVVGAYRAALDGAPQEAVDRELMSISHRPYSTGFYFGEARQNGQAVDYDGYEQETLHVADIVEVAKLDASLELQGLELRERYKVTIRCRNRVAPNDELETLEPGGVSRTFCVKNLMWVGDDSGVIFEAPRECDAANRSCNLYTIELDFAPDVRGFIRRREHRRTGRHLK
jgi:putative protease